MIGSAARSRIGQRMAMQTSEDRLSMGPKLYTAQRLLQLLMRRGAIPAGQNRLTAWRNGRCRYPRRTIKQPRKSPSRSVGPHSGRITRDPELGRPLQVDDKRYDPIGSAPVNEARAWLRDSGRGTFDWVIAFIVPYRPTAPKVVLFPSGASLVPTHRGGER